MMKAADLFEFKTDQLKWGKVQYWPNISFGVLYVGLSDLFSHGAPFSTRMRRLTITTLVGALFTALGANWEVAVLATFVVTLLCGAALAWGMPAVAVAYLLNLWFVFSLSLHGGAAQALPQALAWLIGGALYMLVALIHFRREQSSASDPAQGQIPVQRSGSLFATYFALWRFSSPQFRWVLLKALAVTLASAIGLGFVLPDAQWVPIFTLIVLQPGSEEEYTSHEYIQRLCFHNFTRNE
jgi:hypothetical protein